MIHLLRKTPTQQFHLSCIISLGCYDFFNENASGKTSIKWPNDVYWSDRKAGGILIENVFQASEWKNAVVGVGLNINQTQFGELEKRAVSLRQITGKEYDPLVLAKELHARIMNEFNHLLKDPGRVLDSYSRQLYKKNETVRLKKGTLVFDGIIRDVTNFGELIVAHPLEEKFAVGEVEWVL